MFEALQKQIDLFLEKKEIKEALTQWRLIHKSIANLSLAELDTHINHAHALANCFLQSKTDVDNAQVDKLYSSLQSACVVLPLFDTSRQLTFYEGIAQFYQRHGHHEQALLYGNQGLWLAEKLRLLEATQRFTALLNTIQISYLEPYFTPVLEKFNNRLHLAKNKSLSEFKAVAAELVIFADFLVQAKQWNNAVCFYQQVIEHAEKEAKEFDTTHAYKKLEEVNSYRLAQRVSPTDAALPLWQQWRQELQGYRKEVFDSFESHPNLMVLQQEFSKKLKKLLTKLLKHIESWLGEPPCPFSVAVVGSLSREDATPYSDIDFFVLVKNETDRHHVYFQSLIKLFRLYVNLLGEPNGLRIDSGDLGYLTGPDKLFLTTPEKLAARFDPSLIDQLIEQPETYAMHRPSLLYASKGGEELLSDYIRKINASFKYQHKAWAKRYFTLHLQPVGKYLLVYENQTIISIKEYLLQPMLFFCLDCVLYQEGILEANLLTLLQGASGNIFGLGFYRQLITSIETLQQLRIREQRVNSQESSTITVRRGSTADQSLQSICKQLVFPLYHAMQHLLQKEFADILFQPTQKLLLETLQRFPDPAGVRVFCALEQQQWEDILFNMTDANSTTNTPQTVVLEWVTAKGKQERYLINDYAKQLFTQTGDFNLENKASDGRRYVKALKNSSGEAIAYVKAYPELPGIQTAVDSLSAHVSGDYLKSTVIKCTQPNSNESFPLLISQAVPGETLQSVLRQKKSLEEVDVNVDPKSFTLKVLESLLVNPEDDKPDNIVAEFFTNHEGERKCRLVSVDSDHAFVDPLVETGSVFKKEKVQVKSIVYCFNAMKNELSSQAIKEFLLLDPIKVLTDWLSGLDVYNQRYVGQRQLQLPGLFLETEINRYAESKDFCFIQVFFEPGWISSMYEKFLKLQAALRENPPNDHLELLTLIEPRLALYYEKVFTEHKTARERFQALPTEYVMVTEKQTNTVKYQSTLKTKEKVLRSITIADAQKKKDLKTAIKENTVFDPKKALHSELQAIHERYQNIQLILKQISEGNIEVLEQISYGNYLKERVINNLDFSKLDDEKIRRILWILPGIAFQSLSLKGCSILTDEILEPILKNSPGLREIDLSDCPLLTDTTFFNLAVYCKNICKIVMERTRLNNLQKIFGRSISFPVLRVLHLRECGDLTTLILDVPRLERLFLASCILLNKLEINAQELIEVNTDECKNLPKIMIPEANVTRILRARGGDSSFAVTLYGGHHADGRTSILLRYADKRFEQNMPATIGHSVRGVDLKIQQYKLRMLIWDINAHERTVSMASTHLKGAIVVIWVFDKTDKVGFEVSLKRLQRFRKSGNGFSNETKHLLVGNKIDLPLEKHQVSYAQAMQATAKFQMAGYLECSALTGEGINEVFEYTAYLGLEQQLEKSGIAHDFSKEYERLRQFTVQRNQPTLSKTPQELPLTEIILLGNSRDGGRTSMLRRLEKGAIDKTELSTIGADFFIKSFVVNNYPIKLTLWDLPGDERFLAIWYPFFRRAQVIMWVFDRYESRSLKTCIERFGMFKKYYREGAIHLLVANKIDLPREKNQVTYETAMNVKQELGMVVYLECSAKTGEGLNEVFEYAAYLALEYELRKLGESPDFIKEYARLRQFTVQRNLPIDGELNIVLVGDAVGKSAMAIRYLQKHFTIDGDPTIEQSYRTPIKIQTYDLVMNIKDTARSTDDDGAINVIDVRQAKISIFIFAKNGPFNTGLKSCIDRYLKCKDSDSFPTDARQLLVGNQIDLPEDERSITYDQAIQAKDKYGFADYLECSAKMGVGVKEVFEYAAYLALECKLKSRGINVNFSTEYERLRQFTVRRDPEKRFIDRSNQIQAISNYRRPGQFTDQLNQTDATKNIAATTSARLPNIDFFPPLIDSVILATSPTLASSSTSTQTTVVLPNDDSAATFGK
jgi:small GTP-binding protein